MDNETTTTEPALLDLNEHGINLSDPQVHMSVDATWGANDPSGLWFVVGWQRDYTKPNSDPTNQRPDWMEKDIKDRRFMKVLPVHVYTLVAQGWRAGATIELPCPPYEYEAEGSTLTIKAKGFAKSGTKAEWTEVLAQMQEEVEALPDGIDTSDKTVTIDVNRTVNYSKTLEVSSLLYYHDQMNDDGTWVGDDQELADACEEALQDLVYNEDSDLDNDGMSEMYDGEIQDATFTDLTYDLEN